MSDFQVIKSFPNISKNLVNTSLVFYFNELLLHSFHEEKTNDDILRLYLISIYYLDNGEKDAVQIKKNFEYKLMSFAGYNPDFVVPLDFDTEQYVKECLEIQSFKTLDFYYECVKNDFKSK
jgi:recombinational DNA repair protein (RecF pathway)